MSRIIDAYRLQKEFEEVCVGECDSCREGSCPVYNQPTVDAIPIPEGATNGDMFKAMFPNLKVEDNGGSIYLHYPNGGWIVFDRDFWNAPYKRESEE